VNFLFAIYEKLSSDFWHGSNIYKISENYTQIRCRFNCFSYNMYHFDHGKGSNSYTQILNTYNVIMKSGMCKRPITRLSLSSNCYVDLINSSWRNSPIYNNRNKRPRRRNVVYFYDVIIIDNYLIITWVINLYIIHICFLCNFIN
jgi:hypothetical protein